MGYVNIRVRFFATLREITQQRDLPLDIPEGASAEAAWQCLLRDYPTLRPHRDHLAVAINRSYADFDTALEEGDELAFVPPVSGG